MFPLVCGIGLTNANLEKSHTHLLMVLMGTKYFSLHNKPLLSLSVILTFLFASVVVGLKRELETRVPLIDHKIVEFLFKLPGHLKLHGLETKWLFKKTMERLLPRENIYRKKEGFSIPIKHWLKTDLRDLMSDTLNEKHITKDNFFNFSHIKNMMDLHLAGKKNFSHQLWALLIFEIRKKNYL